MEEKTTEELFKALAAGGPRGGNAVVDLYEDFHDLVRIEAASHWKSWSWLGKEADVLEGEIELLRAIGKSDPTKGAHFESYARSRIDYAMRDAYRKDPLVFKPFRPSAEFDKHKWDGFAGDVWDDREIKEYAATWAKEHDEEDAKPSEIKDAKKYLRQRDRALSLNDPTGESDGPDGDDETYGDRQTAEAEPDAVERQRESDRKQRLLDEIDASGLSEKRKHLLRVFLKDPSDLRNWESRKKAGLKDPDYRGDRDVARMLLTALERLHNRRVERADGPRSTSV